MSEDEIYDEDDPNDLERIVEGEDNTEGHQHNISDNEVEEGREGDEKENEEEKKKIEPKRKRTLNPQPKLNVDRLKGPRGLTILESFFKDVKLKGKGHEKEDLNIIMKRLEHWAHRLYPRFKFDDCLEKIEKLGTKKPIQNYLKRIRLGMEEEETPHLTEEPEEPPLSPPLADPFDELIGHRVSQPSQPIATLTSEQRDRMLRNRMIAEERRMARMNAQQEKQKRQNELFIQEKKDPINVVQAEKELLISNKENSSCEVSQVNGKTNDHLENTINTNLKNVLNKENGFTFESDETNSHSKDTDLPNDTLNEEGTFELHDQEMSDDRGVTVEVNVEKSRVETDKETISLDITTEQLMVSIKSTEPNEENNKAKIISNENERERQLEKIDYEQPLLCEPMDIEGSTEENNIDGCNYNLPLCNEESLE